MLQHLNTNLSKSWFYSSFFLQNQPDGDITGKPTIHPKTSKDLVRSTEVETLDAEAVNSKKIKAHGKNWPIIKSVIIILFKIQFAVFNLHRIFGLL